MPMQDSSFMRYRLQSVVLILLTKVQYLRHGTARTAVYFTVLYSTVIM